MALVDKVRSFIRSPRGQKLMEQGKQQMAKPENKKKLSDFTAKFTRKH